MSKRNSRDEFEQLFLPHLDAAYNLARLLTRSSQDAEDIVQEAYLKAWRSFDDFRGSSSKPWLLTITRNTAFTWMRDNRPWIGTSEYREDFYVSGEASPEALSISLERSRVVERCIRELPGDFREAIVLREMEGLSYQEIAGITGVPQGTVMSRLSRARARLAECLKCSVGLSLFAKRSADDLR